MIANPSQTATPTADERTELADLLRLSAPLVAGYAGNQLMSFVDTAMVGRLGPASLGGVGIGNGIYFTVTVIGMGLVLGLDPIVAQSLGAGEAARARRALWQGVRLALAASVPLMAVIALSTLLLVPFGIEAETAAEAQRFIWGRLPNMIPFLLFCAARSFLQASGGTRAIILAMVVANIANVVGNTLLIYGDAGLTYVGLPPVGLPGLGVFGSGLASSIASFLSLLVVARGVKGIAAPPDPHRRAFDGEICRKIMRLGAPISMQLLAEVGAFGFATALAGRIGREPAAGFQVAITLASFTFTVALAIATATSVLVGKAVGRGDTPAARRTGFLGMRVASTFMGVSALAFFAAPELFARILTDKPEVIAAAVPLLRIAGVFQLPDGLQAVAGSALRGVGDTGMLHKANLIGYYAIGLPLSVALAFGAGLGTPGLWWGLCAGIMAVAGILIWRFNTISKRSLARV